MANSILELQKKFNLFNLGDHRQGIVISIINNSPQIKLKGGALGFVSSESNDYYLRNGINLKIGNVVDVEVIDVVNGVPRLTLISEYVFSNSLQKALVKFAGTQGIVVEFPWKDMLNIGFYAPDKGVDNTLSLLDEGDRVVCKGLIAEPEYYRINELSIDNEQEVVESEPELEAVKENEVISEPDDFQIPKAWDKEQIEKVASQDSLIKKGVYCLGEVYLCRQGKGDLVFFADGNRASIKRRNGFAPVENEDLLVRIIRIYPFGDYKDVEVLDVVNKDYVKYFKKVRLSSLLPEAADSRYQNRKVYIENGFKFGERDNSIYKDGMQNKSEDHFEKYWLGFLYKVFVKNGKPSFCDNNGVGINIKTIDSDDVYFQNGDVVFCRLHYVEKKGNKVTLTVQVLFSREPRPEEKF